MDHIPDRIKEAINAYPVKFIRLQFTDILGITKNVEIPISQLEKAFEDGIMFDGSSVEGFARINESDMRLCPDPETFNVLPWTLPEYIPAIQAGLFPGHIDADRSSRLLTPYRGVTARFLCDIQQPDGTPFAGCARTILKKQIARASEKGLEMMVGPELEFFLFEKGKNGEPTTQTHDAAGYFDLLPVDRGEEARHDMINALEQMGFEIEAAHHEVAPSQHEIDFKYADALITADRIVTFRIVVKTIALDHGLHATFMPKPIYGVNGSGMHVNQSLFKDGNNIFNDPEGEMTLSKICTSYIAGLIEHVRNMSIFTNPTINSYKRLVPGFEAPVRIAWSESNRSPLIRIPAARGKSTRIELRNPDPSCNPYLALACMLAAGLDGIERKLEPPPPIDENVYEMSVFELKKRNIGSLPANMFEAVKAFEEDKLLCDVVGPHITEFISRARREEWTLYTSQVTEWERDRYLKVY